MARKNGIVAVLLLLLLSACAPTVAPPSPPTDETVDASAQPVAPAPKPPEGDDAQPPEAPAPPTPVRPKDGQEFVRVRDYIPDIVVDLRYATADNFTGTVIYSYDDAWLRYDTVEKLIDVQEQLKAEGYRLCIWDALRSAASQQKLWEVCPDGNYVANPANGYSGHTCGDTVDVTLVTLEGGAVEMPSGFDDFSALADRDYADVSAQEAENARLLERVMEDCGFTGYDKEWWHYSDNDRAQPAPEFEPEKGSSDDP